MEPSNKYNHFQSIKNSEDTQPKDVSKRKPISEKERAKLKKQLEKFANLGIELCKEKQKQEKLDKQINLLKHQVKKLENKEI